MSPDAFLVHLLHTQQATEREQVFCERNRLVTVPYPDLKIRRGKGPVCKKIFSLVGGEGPRATPLDPPLSDN